MDFTSVPWAELGLAGVVALWLFKLFAEHRADNIREKAGQVSLEQFNAFNANLLQRVSTLEEKVAYLQEDNAALRIQNESLKTRLIIMESAHQDAPIPMWLKDTSGKMLSVNPAYEQEFLVPMGFTKDDYIGHTDSEVWGTEIGAEYALNDAVVAATKEMWLGTETVATPKGKFQYAIMKYPRMENNFLIGVAGIAIPHSLLKNANLHIGRTYDHEDV